MAWLKINSDPPIVLYSIGQSRVAFEDYLSYPLLVSVGKIRNAVSIDTGGENANTSVELSNGLGNELVILFSIPPLLEECQVFDSSSAEIFSGYITSVRLGEKPSMTIEA